MTRELDPAEITARGPEVEPSADTSIGRYLVIDELGRGAMGQVFRAYDPKLQREVALKVLRAKELGPNAEARMLREARTMAQLSHPHVVSVYDVETDPRRGVIFAMELVTGTTLRRWLRTERSGAEILRVFILAGRGLAAAHRAGLLHRDFKPSNTLVSEDGRVKVTDFGLAKPEGALLSELESSDLVDLSSLESSLPLTQTGVVMGTPRYMAPEQHRGGELSAAADQYAFCVAVWEALVGEPPFRGRAMVTAKEGGPPPWPATASVPRAIGEALRRGLEPRPDQRWPDMDALLERLADDPSRRRRRRWGLGGLVAIVGLGTLAWRASIAAQETRRAERVARCTSEGLAITEVWNDAARDAVRAGLLDTGAGYAETTAGHVMPWLDAQAHSWAEARTEACLDTSVREIWTSDTLDRAVWCLDERRLELSSLVTQLSRADDAMVRHAVGAAAGLAPVAPCRDATVLASRPPPPPPEERARLAEVREQLSRTRALNDAGKYAEALELTRAARASMETLGWAPLRAKVMAKEAALLDHVGEYAEAERVGREAFVVALEATAWGPASTAASQLANTLGNSLGRHSEARTWIELSRASASHAGDPLGLRKATRDTQLANVEKGAGDFARARALYEQALAAEREVYGEEHPRLTILYNYLANVSYGTGDYPGARAMYERTLELLERTYGPDHPQVAMTLQNLAAVELSAGGYAEAQATYERAVEVLERALGPRHPNLAKALTNLGIVHRMMGHYDEALALNERALSIAEEALGPRHPELALLLNNLAIVHRDLGHADKMEPLLQRALEIREQASEPDHASLAALLNNIAFLRLEEDDYAGARQRLERALALNTGALGPEHPDLAYSLLGLAEVALEQQDYAEAKGHFRRALQLREKGLGAEHPKVALSLVGLARIALLQDRPADAIPLTERAISIREQGRASPELQAEARFLLAQALWDAPKDRGRDRARAEALIEQALEQLRPLDNVAHRIDEIERWSSTRGVR